MYLVLVHYLFEISVLIFLNANVVLASFDSQSSDFVLQTRRNNGPLPTRAALQQDGGVRCLCYCEPRNTCSSDFEPVKTLPRPH